MKQKNFLNIDRIAFLGRTYDEYLKIFGLNEDILRKGPLLDCPAGAASFTAEAREKGFDVTACDILYSQPFDRLAKKGLEDLQHVFEKLEEVSDIYTWNHYKNTKEVFGLRKKALEEFTKDFTNCFKERRYVHATLPELPFPDKSFETVLSGHFLFLYGDRLDLDFHRACLYEFVRICRGEVRVYPILGHDAKPYPHIDEIISSLYAKGIKAEIRDVPFEFLKGATQMMVLKRI